MSTLKCLCVLFAVAVSGYLEMIGAEELSRRHLRVKDPVSAFIYSRKKGIVGRNLSDLPEQVQTLRNPTALVVEPLQGHRYRTPNKARGAEMVKCNFTTPHDFDPVPVLKRLYGPWFQPLRPGQGNILVLGNHNSGTSMLARLVMLMGAFQGNADGLSTSPKNHLKYWEKIDVSHFHDMVLGWVSDPKFRPYHSQGIDMNRLTAENRASITCFANMVIKDLNRHSPWVLKDPRMLLFADFWINQMRKPVCVFIFREPIANAVSLAENSKKSAQTSKYSTMTPQRWLNTWEEGMLSALQACRDHPTILTKLEDLQSDLMRFTYKLYAMLGQAGVFHLQMPPKHVLDAEFGDNIRPRNRPEADMRGVRLSRNQTALYSALLMVANTVDMGLSQSSSRADAVLRLYEDTLAGWDEV